MAVVVGRTAAEQDAQEVVAAGVVGDPRQRPHRRRVGRRAGRSSARSPCSPRRPSTPSSRSSSVTTASSYGPPPVTSVTAGNPAPPGIARPRPAAPEPLPGRRPAGRPDRSGPGCRAGPSRSPRPTGRRTRQRGDPPPVHGSAERPPHPDVVERLASSCRSRSSRSTSTVPGATAGRARGRRRSTRHRTRRSTRNRRHRSRTARLGWRPPRSVRTVIVAQIAGSPAQ